MAAQSSLNPFPADEVDTAETVDLITGAIYAAVGTMRDVHDGVDEKDPTTPDILHDILDRLEQLAWMTDAENRIATGASRVRCTSRRAGAPAAIDLTPGRRPTHTSGYGRGPGAFAA